LLDKKVFKELALCDKMNRRKFLKCLEGIAISDVLLISGCSDSTGPSNDPSNQEEVLISGLNEEPYATWSPSGDKILFCLDGNIWAMDNNGSNLEELITFPGKNEKASHPDYKIHHIICQLNHPYTCSNNVSEIYTGTQVKFNLPEGRYEYPTLSPDEKEIVFTFNNKMYGGKFQAGLTWEVPINMKIGKECEWFGMYNWSLYGGIVFSAKTQEGTNIYTIESTHHTYGSESIESIYKRQKTKGNFFLDHNPSWSFDGRFIAFDSDRYNIGGEHNICLIKADEGRIVRLSKGSGKYPRFHPYDDKLLYLSRTGEGWRINLIHNAIQYQNFPL